MQVRQLEASEVQVTQFIGQEIQLEFELLDGFTWLLRQGWHVPYIK